MWFWPRGHVPLDIIFGIPEPALWGVPVSSFAGPCDIKRYFAPQKIVLNLNFCGDWAGYFWRGACAEKATTCRDYVADNPEAFRDSYWSIHSLRVYTIEGEEEEPEGRGSERRNAVTVSIPETVTLTNADVQGPWATVEPINNALGDAVDEETLMFQFRRTMSDFVQLIGAMRNRPQLFHYDARDSRR